jgi:hypothetical protein
MKGEYKSMKCIAIIAFALTTGAAQEYTVTLSPGSYSIRTEGRVVTGAPYSAQAVTETTQVLADGNRIIRKSSSSLARDGVGRTRREQSINFVGPWFVEGGEGMTVSINDPAAGTRYELDPKSKTAVKVAMRATFERSANQELEAKLKQAREMEEIVKGEIRMKVSQNTAKTESLGSMVIEGVQVDGKRITETIPAGRLGNERPIDIINETWFSSDLQTVVMSKHSDPRSGDVVYTLTNIQRVEPDPSLFQVPADYKTREEPAGEMRMRRGVSINP